jgi:DNA-binding PadR family transcriptional regulator
MRQDQDNDDGKQQSRRNRLQKKLDQWHELHSLQHLQRAQFGQRGFLRPQVIELFGQQPMSGVDIMNELQEESHGWYRPSPGSIYPLLEQLEKEGMITKNEEGKYELTAAFAQESGLGDQVAGALSALESNASYLEDLRITDATKLAKCKERIEKLTKRLTALNDALQSGGSRQ